MIVIAVLWIVLGIINWKGNTNLFTDILSWPIFAKAGFGGEFTSYRLPVRFTDEAWKAAAECGMGEDVLKSLSDVLALDPRPAYQKDPERIYKMSYDRYEIGFRVSGDEITVCDIRPA